jgi:hypothetical protein
MTDYIIDHLLEIIAILAAFVIFFMQIRRKALSYSILTNSSVISVSDKVKDRIQVIYDGRVVPSLRLIEIRIKNSGSLPIKPDDYVEPLAFRFSDDTKILSMEVIDNQSLGISLATKLSDQSRTMISKALLNPKDSFDIKILLSEGSTDFSLTGRIVGISKIQASSNLRPSINIKLSTLVPFVIFYTAIIVAMVGDGKYTLVEAVGYVSAGFLGIFLFMYLLKLLEEYDKRHER